MTRIIDLPEVEQAVQQAVNEHGDKTNPSCFYTAHPDNEAVKNGTAAPHCIVGMAFVNLGLIPPDDTEHWAVGSLTSLHEPPARNWLTANSVEFTLSAVDYLEQLQVIADVHGGSRCLTWNEVMARSEQLQGIAR